MQFLHTDFHWLAVADRVRYKLGVTVHLCLHNKALSTWQTAVSPSQTSTVVSDYAQHTITRWTYRVTNATHSAVEHSLSPDSPSGTRFQNPDELRDPRSVSTKPSDKR